MSRETSDSGTNLQIRRDAQVGSEDGAIERLRVQSRDNASWEPRGGYWTPSDGELLSIWETPAGSQSEGVPTAGALPVLPISAEEYGPPALVAASADADDLQLVLVRRQLDPLTHSEFRAIALQAIMCAFEYEDLRWLRSYWARSTNQLFCLFETRSHDLVREHADRSRIPCDEVLDAIELKVPS